MKNKQHTTGFSIPDNYFEGLENRMLEKYYEEYIPKNTGFIVPKHYFDTVEQTILTSISEEIPVTTQKVLPLYKRKTFLIVASVAACIACIVSIINFSSETPIALKNIQTDAIALYIEDGNLALSTQEIAILLEEEEFNGLEITSEAISKEIITDYLLNTIDDPTLLLE